jgi:hypothetical protein
MAENLYHGWTSYWGAGHRDQLLLIFIVCSWLKIIPQIEGNL